MLRRFAKLCVVKAESRALPTAGIRSDRSKPMIETTTSSSMMVNPDFNFLYFKGYNLLLGGNKITPQNAINSEHMK